MGITWNQAEGRKVNQPHPGPTLRPGDKVSFLTLFAMPDIHEFNLLVTGTVENIQHGLVLVLCDACKRSHYLERDRVRKVEG